MKLDDLLKDMRQEIPDNGFTDRVMTRIEEDLPAWDLDHVTSFFVEIGIFIFGVLALKSSLIQTIFTHLDLSTMGLFALGGLLIAALISQDMVLE